MSLANWNYLGHSDLPLQVSTLCKAVLSRIPFRLITQERVRCEQVEITASWPIHLHHHSNTLLLCWLSSLGKEKLRARLWKLFSGGKSPSTLSRHHVTSQVWIGSWMVNYFPWHALTIFEGTTTVSNTWTWRKPDRRMRCLWKMFTSFGFLFLSSTTLRTMRRQRCQKVSHNMILISKYKGQHGGKKGKQIWARPPPLFGQCPKENVFFYKRCSLILRCIYRIR